MDHTFLYDFYYYLVTIRFFFSNNIIYNILCVYIIYWIQHLKYIQDYVKFELLLRCKEKSLYAEIIFYEMAEMHAEYTGNFTSVRERILTKKKSTNFHFTRMWIQVEYKNNFERYLSLEFNTGIQFNEGTTIWLGFVSSAVHCYEFREPCIMCVLYFPVCVIPNPTIVKRGR